LRCAIIDLSNGTTKHALEIAMVPEAPVLLAQVLADNIGISRDQMIWFGSPAWVVSGAITDAILAKAADRVDERRRDDIRRLAELAAEHGKFITDAAIVGFPALDLSKLRGHGPAFDFDQALPATRKWKGLLFGGSEGTFAGIPPNRERRAREMLRQQPYDYVIDPWSPVVACRTFGEAFEIPKQQIRAVRTGYVHHHQLLKPFRESQVYLGEGGVSRGLDDHWAAVSRLVRWSRFGDIAAEHGGQEGKGPDQQAEEETQGTQARAGDWCSSPKGQRSDDS
jgi:hypothetical protein